MKKLLSILLILCLAISLAACGSSGSSTGSIFDQPGQNGPSGASGQNPWQKPKPAVESPEVEPWTVTEEPLIEPAETPTENGGSASRELREYQAQETERSFLSVEDHSGEKSITIQEEPPVVYRGRVTEGSKEQVYSFTPPRDGRYAFTLSELKAGTSVKIEVLDALDHQIMVDYSEGSYEDLSASQRYTVKVSYYRTDADYTLTIGIQKPSVDLSEGPVVHDQVSFPDQINLYSFTPPRSGRYSFRLSEVKAGLSFKIAIYDHLQNQVMVDFSGGDAVDLEEGETYTVKLSQNNGFGSYVLTVGMQKPTTDLTGSAGVNDCLTFEEQINCYLFTPPVTGTYGVRLAETKANLNFVVIFQDHLDNRTAIYDLEDTVELVAGEQYRVQVKQRNGLGSYRLELGYQKETADVSGYDLVKDTMSFEGQVNYYSFRPELGGTYRVTLTSDSAPVKQRLKIIDSMDYSLGIMFNGDDTFELEAGKTYSIQVSQYEGLGGYSMRREHVD